MTRKATARALSQMSEINLTPLMDLTFLLLITFIITFPLVEQGISVRLPKGKTSDLTQKKSHTITVDAAGAVYLNSVKIEQANLAQEMDALGKRDPEATVLVRADEAIAYGQVVKVLKVLHDAKVTRMALVTQAEE